MKREDKDILEINDQGPRNWVGRVGICPPSFQQKYLHTARPVFSTFRGPCFILYLFLFREYNWIVKSKANKGYEENYFMVQREDGFYYNELETRVRLSKRRLKAGQQASNSKLVVRHRPMIKQELKMQRYRERNLEPPNEVIFLNSHF